MVEVCPSPEELEYSGPVQCPVEGCGKELPSSACLRMHVTRRHHGKPLERTPGHSAAIIGRCVDFYCPVRDCNRSRESGKPFPRLGQLKQHYQTIHGQKSYSCAQCGKKFALRDMYNRHCQECQQKIVCATCGMDFRSRNALYQHAKRKGHTLPAGKKGKATSKAAGSSPTVNVVLVPIPTSIKLVVPIPKIRNVVSSSTQTEEAGLCAHNVVLPSPQPEVELQSSSSQTITELLSPYSFNHTHLLHPPSELLSFGTQTMPQEATPLIVSTQSCQTQSAQLCDFGTQTHVGTSHVATCMPSTVISSCDSSSCSALDLVEFGTQTSSELHNINESDMVNFGTQTIGMSSLELDDSLFSRHFLPPECLDFGTQTLEFPYSVPHCMQTCLHCSDTRDQGSQT